MKVFITIISLLVSQFSLFGQVQINQDSSQINSLKPLNTNKSNGFLDKFELHGYGALNYFRYNWETDTAKRNDIDLERFVLEPTIHLSDKFGINAEIEIEHGGTGAAVEFDRFEEFGEFEYEIEKGGEVILEQLNLEWNYNPYLNLKAGRIKVPFGLYYAFDEPVDYFTPTITETESHLLPTSWTEFGFSIFGKLGHSKKLKYVVGLVTGLDNSAFSSSTWIKRGNQKRFETVNAEDWAGVLRLDYALNDKLLIGCSGYFGNSTDNRPKPDIKVPGYVGLAEFHTVFDYGIIQAKALIMYGNLSNAEKISIANRNLSNNLNVKRTPVASSVLGAYAELGIDLLKFGRQNNTGKEDKLILYGRFDYYDSMYETEGTIFNNPRWERKVWGAGLNYQPIEELVFKLYYTSRKFGIPVRNLENTLMLGFGFEF